MNCIIIDDDKIARVIVKQLCLKSTHLTIKEEFSNAIDAIKYLNNHTVDVVFLDIHMPSFSGFDFIQTLKNPPKIILTTSDKNYALEAFEYNCIVDYLVKPISKERFNKAIQKIKPVEATFNNDEFETQNNYDYLYINIEKRLVKIDIANIYLIEAKGDYINIKTTEQNYIVHATLKKIENKLPLKNFFKVHRSYIINISEIVDIEDNSVLIRKSVIPISRSKKNELISKLNLL